MLQYFTLDRLLCGAGGSIDLKEWIEDAEEGPIGPALFKCMQTSETLDKSLPLSCKFDENRLNGLITQVSKFHYRTLTSLFSSLETHTLRLIVETPNA